MTKERFFEIAREEGFPEKRIENLWNTRSTDDLNEPILRQTFQTCLGLGMFNPGRKTMPNSTAIKIAEIRQRLQEFRAHSNDPYAYDIDEIDAVRNFKAQAAQDIEFLLTLKSPEVKIEVKCESESGCSHDPAKVRVYQNGELVYEVTGKLELQPGADGGQYYCIILKKTDLGEKADG